MYSSLHGCAAASQRSSSVLHSFFSYEDGDFFDGGFPWLGLVLGLVRQLQLNRMNTQLEG